MLPMNILYSNAKYMMLFVIPFILIFSRKRKLTKCLKEKRENIDNSTGVYINKHNNVLVLSIYMKLDKLELINALPLSNIPDNHDYIFVHIRNGCDYIGSANLDIIQNYIIIYDAINLFEGNYNTIKNKIPSIKEEEYFSMLLFARSQLK